MGTGSFTVKKSGRGVTLTLHPLLVPWSWKGRAIPLLPLWAVRPVQSLSACTSAHFTLPYGTTLHITPEDTNFTFVYVSTWHLALYWSFYFSNISEFWIWTCQKQKTLQISWLDCSLYDRALSRHSKLHSYYIPFHGTVGIGRLEGFHLVRSWKYISATHLYPWWYNLEDQNS